MIANFQVFRGGPLTSWESLFHEASSFASGLGPDRVISISHSEDRNVGIVTVWYWSGVSGGERGEEQEFLGDADEASSPEVQ